MAIVIQEEKNTGSWFGFWILITILIIVGVALYYLFFVEPELLTSVSPSKTAGSIEEFSQINFDPRSVMESDLFKGKKQHIPVTSPVHSGNLMPFGVR